jgi:hypothetical protein
MQTCDDHVLTLDKKYPGKWDIYRSMLSRWIVQITASDGSKRTVDGETLGDALRAAVEFTPLLLIPREPTVYRAGNYSIKKNGTRWRVYYAGDLSQEYATKKECQKMIEAVVIRSGVNHQAWVAKYFAIVDKGKPGVDFEWSLY